VGNLDSTKVLSGKTCSTNYSSRFFIFSKNLRSAFKKGVNQCKVWEYGLPRFFTNKYYTCGFKGVFLFNILTNLNPTRLACELIVRSYAKDRYPQRPSLFDLSHSRVNVESCKAHNRQMEF